MKYIAPILFLFISTFCTGQIQVIKNDSSRTINFNANDRVKIVYHSRHKNLYSSVLYGKSSSMVFGKIFSLSDSDLVIKKSRTVFRPFSIRTDTIPYKSMIGITKYHQPVALCIDFALFAGIMVATVPLIAPPLILPVSVIAASMVRIGDDKVIYPPKKISSEDSKWKSTIGNQ